MNFFARLKASMSTAKRYFVRSSSVKIEPDHPAISTDKTEPDLSAAAPVQMELDLSTATEEILLEIFLRVDEKVLVKNCTQVRYSLAANVCQVIGVNSGYLSTLWHRLLSMKSFWIRKCDYNGYLTGHEVTLRQLPLDLMKICVLRPFDNNLIDDSGASGTPMARRSNPKYSRSHGHDRRWQMGGNFAHEEPPQVMGSHKDADFDETGIDKCLAASNIWCTKLMEIDLLAMGLDAETLDQLRPAITVSEYVVNRSDCAAYYRIDVRLLGEEVEKSEKTFWEDTKMWEQWETQKWTKIEHTFRKYPSGVRRIELLCAGRDAQFLCAGGDAQFWAGHYGPKMARCSVLVHLDFNPPSATAAPTAP